MSEEQLYVEEDAVKEQEHARGSLVMPFYIICDISYSMVGDMRDLNDGLQSLVDEISADPVADDMTMLSLITFNSNASVAVPLSRPSDISVPTLYANGGTTYSSAIRTYHDTFESDRAALKAKGHKVYRPCVFFLTDGEPQDNPGFKDVFNQTLAWDPATQSGNKAFPYMVSFGFRDASFETLKAMAYPPFGETKGRAFLAKSGEKVQDMLKSIVKALGNTVISSGNSAIGPAGPAGAQIIPPEPAPGDGLKMQFAEGDLV